MTGQEAEKSGRKALEAAGVPDPGHDARELILFALGLSLPAYLADWREEVPPEDMDRFRALIRRRSERVPLQEILGEADFMGYRFRVSPKVLIPRQDTETLVLAAERCLSQGSFFLDLCTGSGCIAISLLMRNMDRLPGLHGIASDLSGEALSLAKENSDFIGTDNVLSFRYSNLFQEIPETFDLIVSNPPYIPTGEIAGLMPEVRDHDPRLALDGGEDGLSFYRRIAPEALKHLRPGGWLLLEIGSEEGEAVRSIFAREGYLDIRVEKDLGGRDRVVYGRKETHV